MEMIRTVILDLGNVLVFHDNDLLTRNLASALGVSVERVSALGARITDDINRGRLDGEGIYRAFTGELASDLPFERFREVWSSHFTLHREVLPRVEALIGRVRLALLSNTNALHVDFLRPQLPLLERFDALLFSNELRMAKPDAEFYREALRRTGTQPAEALFFDDIPRYVEAAQAVGIHGYLFTTADAFQVDLARWRLT
ncbi:MAG TPA: HAD family phosphatase [Myxococcaceae bacterium]|nr:HAD family phosphatase [Myxococcaceae bacterium]